MTLIKWLTSFPAEANFIDIIYLKQRQYFWMLSYDQFTLTNSYVSWKIVRILQDGKFVRNLPLTENLQNQVGSYEYIWISLRAIYVRIAMRLHFWHNLLNYSLIRKTKNKIIGLYVIFTMIFLCVLRTSHDLLHEY